MNMRFLSPVVAMLLYAGGVQAQFSYTTNSDTNTITITGYTGPGGDVVIPATISNLQVTAIGNSAFQGVSNMTAVTIPDGIQSIGNSAFADCFFTNVVIPESVTNIGRGAFGTCTNLVTVSVPDSVTTLGRGAFAECYSMTSASIGNGVRELQVGVFTDCYSLDHVTIGSGVTNIGNQAFYIIKPTSDLHGIYFRGDAPTCVSGAFFGHLGTVVVFYVPGTAGWGSTYAGNQTIPWDPEILNLGVGANGFGFTIKEYGFSSTYNYISVVKACTNLVDGTWIPLQTNVPNLSPTYPFNDPQWTNHPARFYRVDMP